MSAREELEKLLSESVASARTRGATAFDEIAGDRPIVLFGAGGLGKKIALVLEKLGRPAVAFADNNRARVGEKVAGVPILATEDAVAKYGDDAVFVVAVWRAPATERMSDRIERLAQLGAKHVTSFATLAWKYPAELLPYYAMDLPHQVIEVKDDVMRAFELLADEPSRREYLSHLRLRLRLDFAGISDPADEPEYFTPNLVTLTKHTSFVDCGAFDGDTARSFLRCAPADFAGRISAFEPDPGTFARLAAWRDSQPEDLKRRIAIHQAGVGARSETVTFADGGGWGSAVSSTGTTIRIVSLDETVADAKPTLIKVDVEGYDPDVVEGARKIITETTPTLAVCVYHRQDHPWRIPLQIAAMNPSYRYTLRTYCLDGFDLVLYCVPRTS